VLFIGILVEEKSFGGAIETKKVVFVPINPPNKEIYRYKKSKWASYHPKNVKFFENRR
jgi:hypothetical protein